MSTVRIRSVASYEDTDAIRSFVDGILRMDARIEAMLRAGDSSRLVVVKPNWVQQAHERKPGVWLPVITHPSLILILLECLGDMMRGQGTVCLCDAPHTYADFAEIAEIGGLRNGLDRLRKQWPAFRIELLDLRREIWFRKEEVIVERRPNQPDPRGYVRVDLGRDGLFHGYSGEGRYFGADYDTAVVNAHHRGDLQEYLVAGSPMACDLFINLPKMKTHKKAGLTCCLKNLVGVTGDKDWLPHFVEGTPRSGGDEFPDATLATAIEMRLKKKGQLLALRFPKLGGWIFRKVRNVGKSVLGDSEHTIRAGNWLGNDTCWRMVVDLNRALLYGNMDGSLRDASKPKPYLAIVDGIVAGEGNGPLCPEPVEAGILAGGVNPAAIDACVSRLMGFAPEGLPGIRNAFAAHKYPIADCAMEDVMVEDERVGQPVPLSGVGCVVPGGFRPAHGWTGMRRLLPE